MAIHTDTVLARLATSGAAHTAASRAVTRCRKALRGAVAEALGAGVEQSDVVAEITGPAASTTRSGAYKIFKEVRETAAETWRAAGEPSATEARTRLGHAEQAARTAQRHHRLGSGARLIEDMADAIGAGIAPSVVVAESGQKDATGYRYLSIARDYRAVRALFHGDMTGVLLDGGAAETVDVRATPVGVQVRNLGEVVAPDYTEEYGRIERIVQQRLGEAGFSAAPSTGRLVTVHRTKQEETNA